MHFCIRIVTSFDICQNNLLSVKCTHKDGSEVEFRFILVNLQKSMSNLHPATETQYSHVKFHAK